MKDSVTFQKKRETALEEWRKQEKQALQLLKIVGDLRFDRGIELVIFRQEIYDSRPSEVLNHHKISKNYIDKDISIDLTLSIAKELEQYNHLLPVKIDIGKIAAEYLENGQDTDIHTFVGKCIDHLVGNMDESVEPTDVVLYGFGRIGRLLARRLISTTGRGDQLRLRAVVLRQKMSDVQSELEKRAALLSSDSVHGDFQGTVEVNAEDQAITVNGNKISFIFAGHPSEIDYTTYGIHNAVVIDNTGVWRDKEALAQHLRPGVDKVLLTAPGKNVPNIVYGVNQADADNDQLLSAASCTTNAIVPVIKAIDDRFGIEKGHIETIHAYTSDQNLLDNFHKKPRRGRAAALNMVLTSTGAANAVSKVMPHLKGKLTGNAVRVPTPDVSLAIMNLTLNKATDLNELNDHLRNVSLKGDFVEQIHYSNSTEYVSSNAIGMMSTSVVDAPSNIISEDGKNATIYAWYDNEYGYCCQVVRLAKYITKVRRPRYY